MNKYILILFLGITISLNAQVCLDVPVVIQEQTNWCWAASAKCVLDYYGKVYRQCEIAEYVRKNDIFHNFGTVDCCDDASQGCNQTNSLGSGTGTVEDILMEFGEINNVTCLTLQYSEINFHLGRQRPLIMRWESLTAPTHGHDMVIYGTDVNGVEFMDPDKGYDNLPYNTLLNNGTYKWTHTLTPQRSPFPDHCYNCYFEPNKGEEAIDCGGPCPPCKHAPDKVIINTATNNLPSDVRAINKITAGNAAVKVLSGQNVTFTTAGEIELLPGFEIDAGANFNTQVKDDPISLTQICGKFCKEDRYGPYNAYKYKDIFRGYHLVNVDRIEYRITDLQSGRPVYENIVHISDYGTVDLWDLIEGAGSNSVNYYVAAIWVYPCSGGVDYGTVKFWVYDFDKSLNSEQETEETESSAPFLSPSVNSTPQIEKQTDNFFIIPNPNSGTFQIEPNFPLSDIAHLKVVDVMGTTVYETQNVTANTIQLQTPAQGQFFVVVFLKEGGMITKKMLIQR